MTTPFGENRDVKKVVSFEELDAANLERGLSEFEEKWFCVFRADCGGIRCGVRCDFRFLEDADGF